MNGLIAHVDTDRIGYEELKALPCPDGTRTHRPIPHHDVVDALVETLGFRNIGVHKMEFAASKDGQKMFGFMELTHTFSDCRFALGIRNSHDKSMALALTVGYRVFVCDNMSFHGDFYPVMARHTKNFQLLPAISYGVDQIQRKFEPLVQAVNDWRETQITDTTAKLLIYEAFVEGKLDAPRHLDRVVHDCYFNPQLDAFEPRTEWSLQNAFTSAFKQLDPIPQYKATASLAGLLA